MYAPASVVVGLGARSRALLDAFRELSETDVVRVAVEWRGEAVHEEVAAEGRYPVGLSRITGIVADGLRWHTGLETVHLGTGTQGKLCSIRLASLNWQ